MDNAFPPPPEPVTAEQFRAARCLLRLPQRDLAARADIPLPALRRLEGVGGTAKVSPDILSRARMALEQAGAVFLPDGVKRAAVRADRPLGLAEKLAKVRAIQAAVARLPVQDSRPADQMFTDLYDENGLPT